MVKCGILLISSLQTFQNFSDKRTVISSKHIFWIFFSYEHYFNTKYLSKHFLEANIRKEKYRTLVCIEMMSETDLCFALALGLASRCCLTRPSSIRPLVCPPAGCPVAGFKGEMKTWIWLMDFELTFKYKLCSKNPYLQ